MRSLPAPILLPHRLHRSLVRILLHCSILGLEARMWVAHLLGVGAAARTSN